LLEEARDEVFGLRAECTLQILVFDENLELVDHWHKQDLKGEVEQFEGSGL
jgi:hypothetical protein